MIISLLLTWALTASAQEPPLLLEPGEQHLLTQKFSKIWIEDQNIIQVVVKAPAYFIKALKPGRTHFRLDNNLYSLSVLPLESKKAISHWQILKDRFVGLHVGLCQFRACLTGKLYRLQDYEKILSLMEENNSQIYLALDVSDKLQMAVQNLISQRLRKNAVTPHKVIFSKPWNLSLHLLTKYTEQELQKLGVLAQQQDGATDIANNVKVAVKVVEVSENFEKKLGVRWPDSIDAQIINEAQILGPQALDIAITAAEKNGKAKVLASPNLICRSGKEASFFAGGEFPVKVVSLHSKEVSWKRYGVGLKLKPLIDGAGQMSLQIETEVSTLDRSISIDDLPALHTNRVSSFFDLINSKTIAISGLIKSESSENSEGIPFLKNIPVLGALFESKNFQQNKSKLIIFVTPELFN
jgi:pilus assembly protein CpaC